jgi:hypothetical protein
MAPVPEFWNVSWRAFQKHIQIVPDSGESPIPFPLVLVPSDSSVTLSDLLEGAKKELAPQPGDTLESNQIRKLLDKNGGAICLKSLPLRSVEDFSQFLDALSGSGNMGWYPYDAVAMNVLRKVQAKNVLTVNEYVTQAFIPKYSTGFTGTCTQRAPFPCHYVAQRIQHLALAPTLRRLFLPQTPGIGRQDGHFLLAGGL